MCDSLALRTLNYLLRKTSLLVHRRHEPRATWGPAPVNPPISKVSFMPQKENVGNLQMG